MLRRNWEPFGSGTRLARPLGRDSIGVATGAATRRSQSIPPRVARYVGSIPAASGGLPRCQPEVVILPAMSEVGGECSTRPFSPLLCAALAVSWLVAGGAPAATEPQPSARESVIQSTPVVERLIDAGGAIAGWSIALERFRVPLLLLVTLGLAVRLRKGVGRGGATVPLLVVVVAWIGQSFLLQQRLELGIPLLALSAALYWQWGPSRRGSLGGPPIALELVLLLLFLGAAAVACLHRIDVYPQLYYDEIAYLKAARMGLGQLEPGAILSHGGTSVYSYEQFRSQTAPFLMHVTAIAALGPGVLPLRLVSVIAVVAALLLAVWVLRSQLGAWATLGMVALAGVAPLSLIYGRTGLYISVSVLHGVAVFAALQGLIERWNARRAALLGALLGGSLYFYQLSWFVPILALLAVLACPELTRRAGARRLAVVVALSAGLVALPGLLAFRSGLRDVNAQTFDRAVWNRIDPSRPRAALAIPAADATPAGIQEFAERFRSPQLRIDREDSGRGRAVLLLNGEASLVEHGLVAAREAGWLVLDDPWRLDAIWERIPAMLARIFYAPSPESAGRWVEGPLLNPIVSPLVLLGLVVAAKRRRELPMRLLLVWVVAGGLLPAAIGGVMPRRTVLMLPFVYGVAALPVLEIGALIRRRGRVAAAVFGGAIFALVCGIVLTNGFRYFRIWDERVADYPGAPQILEFNRLLTELGGEQVVLLPRMFKDHQMMLLEERARPDRAAVIEEPGATTAEGIRKASCRHQTPFAWVTADTSAERAKFGVLDRDFLYRSETRGQYRVLHVGVRKRDGCVPGGYSSPR